MALAIREIPVHTGKTAIAFVNEADKYVARPVPRLTETQESRIRAIKDAHKSFVW